jgi:hypothetical protein
VVEFGQLVGTWRLVRARMYTRDGDTSANMYGPDPNGVLLYAPDGGVSATIQASEGDGDVSYAGLVSLVDGVLTHRVLVGDKRFPIGEELVRYVEFDEDGQLVLTVRYPDGAVKFALVWRAVDA